MPEPSSGTKPIAVAGFAIAVLGISVLVLRGEILARHWPLMAVQAGAIALMVWARLTFGLRSFNIGAAPTEGELITAGPYRFWRHPIYAAVIIFAAAAAASRPSPLAIGSAFAVVAGLGLRMYSEEQLLAEKYPAYGSYAAKTARVIPGIFAILLLTAQLRGS